MITRSKLKEAITTARVRYVTRRPFWGMIGLRAPIIETTSVCTAATDGVNIYFNPDWMIEQIKGSRSATDTIQFVVAHEIYHILFNTADREGGRDHDLWNIASDYIINRDLKEEFRSIPENCLYSSDFHDTNKWYTERVYEWIKDNSAKKSDGSYTVVLPSGKSSNVLPWDNDSVPMYPNMSRNAADEAKKAWNAAAVKAYQAAQIQGCGHGYLQRLINSILAPKLPWRALLSDFVTTFARDDYSYDKLDPAYMQSDILMPSLYNMTLEGVIAVDTSGSISLEQAKEFVSEVSGVLSAFPGARLMVVFADDAVHNSQVISNITELDLERAFKEGGGGTKFEPTFKYLEDNGIEPTFFAYLTDGYGSYPDTAPGYSVMWVINNNSYQDNNVPFGRVIRMVD